MELTIIDKSRQELLDNLKKDSVFKKSAAELKEAYMSLTIKDVNDKEGALKVATAKKHMVKIRTTLDKFRKAVGKPLADAKKEVDKTAADMQKDFDVIESYLAGEESKIQRELDKIEFQRKEAVRNRYSELNKRGLFLQDGHFVCTTKADGIDDLSVPVQMVGSTEQVYFNQWGDEAFAGFLLLADKRQEQINELLKTASNKYPEQPVTEIPNNLIKGGDGIIGGGGGFSGIIHGDVKKMEQTPVQLCPVTQERCFKCDGECHKKAMGQQVMGGTIHGSAFKISKISDIDESELGLLLLAAVYVISGEAKITADEALGRVIEYKQANF